MTILHPFAVFFFPLLKFVQYLLPYFEINFWYVLESSPNVPEWSHEVIFWEPNKNVIGTFHVGYF